VLNACGLQGTCGAPRAPVDQRRTARRTATGAPRSARYRGGDSPRTCDGYVRMPGFLTLRAAPRYRRQT